MKVIYSIAALTEIIKLNTSKSVGFVPTMGFLHEGHLALVHAAKKENDLVVMSIFVNPLQFGPNEDYERYPRNEQQDVERAKEHGVDILFIPSVTEMYPRDMSIQLRVVERTNVLCGKSRPGHFDGVVTVLMKLFHLVQPTKAYFGLKDAQQFAVVKSLVEDGNFPLSVVGLETVRDKDGLAKSSRNVYLSETEYNEAKALSQIRGIIQEKVQQGMKQSNTLEAIAKDYIQANIRAKMDYVSMLSYPALKPIEEITGQVILAMAVQFDKARLIDNIILQADGTEVVRISSTTSHTLNLC